MNGWSLSIIYHGEDEIGQRISALANAANICNQPFGYLVFGVEDQTHTVVGTDFKPSQKKVKNGELENWLIQRLSPRIDFRIYEFEYENKSVVLFEIPAAENEPIGFIHVKYIRVGSITRKLADFPTKERQIWNKNGVTFERGIALSGCTATDIVELLSTHTYFELLGLPYPTHQSAVIERFVVEGLVVKTTEGYDITNLGGILLAKDLSNFSNLQRKKVRVIQYSGTNKLDTIKDEEFNEGYAVCFISLVKYVNDLLPHNEEIGLALRSHKQKFPQLAIRELIANSIIHQDFSVTGTGTMVEIYADRIEFVNAGTPLIKLERFIDEYRSRNEKLASLLRRMKICEEKGSGIDKVILQCELNQLPAPYFSSGEVHTKVVLYAYKQLKDMDKNEKMRAVYQHACLKWVSNDFMTNQSLRERLKIESKNYSMASRLIRDALAENLIKEADAENKSRKYAKYLPYWA